MNAVDWERLALTHVHPIRVKIYKAYDRSKAPLSPKLLAKRLRVPLGVVSYHVRELVNAGVLIEVDRQQRRGAIEHFYSLDRKSRLKLRVPPKKKAAQRETRLHVVA